MAADRQDPKAVNQVTNVNATPEDTREALVKKLREAAVDFVDYAKAAAKSDAFIPEIAISEWRDWAKLLREAADQLAAPPQANPVEPIQADPAAGWTAERAFAQLEACGYECEGGTLSNNVAYIWLKEQVLEALNTIADVDDARDYSLAKGVVMLAERGDHLAAPVSGAERLARAEAEAGGTVSVGGLVTRLEDDPPPQCKMCGMEAGQHLAQCPRLAAPVGEPEQPPIEVGDWVLEDTGHLIRVMGPNECRFYNESGVGVVEIRKADGRIWRKP